MGIVEIIKDNHLVIIGVVIIILILLYKNKEAFTGLIQSTLELSEKPNINMAIQGQYELEAPVDAVSYKKSHPKVL